MRDRLIGNLPQTKNDLIHIQFTKNSIIEWCKKHERYCIMWRGGKHERVFSKKLDEAHDG